MPTVVVSSQAACASSEPGVARSVPMVGSAAATRVPSTMIESTRMLHDHTVECRLRGLIHSERIWPANVSCVRGRGGAVVTLVLLSGIRRRGV